jgi:hypothetical protein
MMVADMKKPGFVFGRGGCRSEGGGVRVGCRDQGGGLWEGWGSGLDHSVYQAIWPIVTN